MVLRMPYRRPPVQCLHDDDRECEGKVSSNSFISACVALSGIMFNSILSFFPPEYNDRGSATSKWNNLKQLHPDCTNSCSGGQM